MSTENTGSEVWADSAYRSKRNEKWLSDQMLTSRIHWRKPKGKPMPKVIARANAAKSSIRAHVEHVFTHQKNRVRAVHPYHRFDARRSKAHPLQPRRKRCCQPTAIQGMSSPTRFAG